MARVKLIEPEERPDQSALIERIRKGRRGTVINVYKTLMHNPDIASVWLDRQCRALEGCARRLREIVIVRVSYFNRCPMS
jgi:hypothetical protein